MAYKNFLFVFLAAATSARHLTEVNRHLVQPLDPEYDASSHNDQIVQRRNIDYNSRTSTNAHHRPEKYSSYYIDQESHQQHVPDYQSSIKIDNYNVMGQENTNENIYNESEYGVRTSVYSPKPVVDLNDIAYTNLKSKQHLPPHKNRSNMPNNQFHSVTVTQKTNNLLPAYEESLKTNINPVSQNSHSRTQSYSYVNHVEVPSMLIMTETETNPIVFDSRDGQIPKTQEPSGNEEEGNGFIWGSDTKSSDSFLSDGDLDDRSSFVGDKCPTGYVKVCGKCIEQH